MKSVKFVFRISHVLRSVEAEIILRPRGQVWVLKLDRKRRLLLVAAVVTVSVAAGGVAADFDWKLFAETQGCRREIAC